MESMLFKTILNRLPPIDSRLRTCLCWNDIEGRLVAQKKPLNAQRLFCVSVMFRSVVHESNLTHQPSVHRLVGGGVVEQVAQYVAAGLLLLALPTENLLDL